MQFYLIFRNRWFGKFRVSILLVIFFWPELYKNLVKIWAKNVKKTRVKNFLLKHFIIFFFILLK